MSQGINKEYIFDKSEDIKFYIKLMRSLLKEYEIEIISYCIMSNHTHMLIKVEKIDDLSKYMQRLNLKYSKYYNQKYNRVGYVFRDRFKSEAICNEKHFYNCMKYIYTNPVRAGICKEPKEYPYSNYEDNPVEVDNIQYSFIDVDEDKEKVYSEEIVFFLNKRNMDMERLKVDIEALRELTKILMDKHKLSWRKVSSLLGIGRKKLKNLCDK